jgi:hypothetical protein
MPKLEGAILFLAQKPRYELTIYEQKTSPFTHTEKIVFYLGTFWEAAFLLKTPFRIANNSMSIQ